MDIDRLHVGPQGAGLDATHAEQVPDEAIEPIGFVDHEIEQLVARLFVVLRSTRRSVATARIAASGVRRSCDTDRSSARRCSSTCCSDSTFVVTSALTTNATTTKTTSATTSSPRLTCGRPSGGSTSLNATRRGGRDDEAGGAPAEHRGPDDRDDEHSGGNRTRDVVVQGCEHDRQEETGHEPADDRGPAMEAFEARATCGEACQPRGRRDRPRAGVRKQKVQRYTLPSRL